MISILRFYHFYCPCGHRLIMSTSIMNSTRRLSSFSSICQTSSSLKAFESLKRFSFLLRHVSSSSGSSFSSVSSKHEFPTIPDEELLVLPVEENTESDPVRLESMQLINEANSAFKSSKLLANQLRQSEGCYKSVEDYRVKNLITVTTTSYGSAQDVLEHSESDLDEIKTAQEENMTEDVTEDVNQEQIPDPFLLPFDKNQVFNSHIRKRFKELRFKTPTPIQAQSLPYLIGEKRDLVGVAPSGSGKTLCFIIPALLKTLSIRFDEWTSPNSLIITPTRELAHQVEREVKNFRFARSICLYGGVSRAVQMMLLKEAKPHIVIATPGRLNDILEKEVTHLNDVKYLVIDEADMMLKMGMEKNFRSVMSSLPQVSDRQTCLFSATWPNQVQTLARDYLKPNFVTINVGRASKMKQLTVNPNIKQIIQVSNRGQDKDDHLLKSLDKYVPVISGTNKTIIFVNKRYEADRLAKMMKDNDIFARPLHADMEQQTREYVIKHFRKGTIPIIICTDVASRGLDFKNVSLVINYDFPKDLETYIHRIGRTARHTQFGVAYTLFAPEDHLQVEGLIHVLRDAGQQVNPALFDLIKSEEKQDKLP